MKVRNLLLISFAFSLAASLYGQKVLPVLNDPLQNRTSLVNGTTESIDLDTIFGTEAIDDQVVRFTTQSSIGSLTLDFALFTNRTPGTRANFLNYVNDGDYIRSIIHRSVPNFVIQGGGFYDSNPTVGQYNIASVPTDAPIINEFGISNTYGTISMAKLGGDPDSATSQWFVSLGDNSQNLDNQNGGFTVFGRVTKSTISNALSMGSFRIWDLSQADPLSPFGQVPLNPEFVGGIVQEEDLVLFTTVELVDIDPSDASTSTALIYSLVANTNPSVVTASIVGGTDLQLDYSDANAGSSLVTVRATDSVGNAVEDTVIVTVSYSDYNTWQNAVFNPTELADPLISGADVDANGDGLTNLELYLHGLNRNDFQQEPVEFSDTIIAEARYPTFTFPILNTISDINYTIERSTDLGVTDDWSPVAFSEVSRSSNGPIDTVTIRTNAPASEPSDFFRVRFIQTSP